MRRIGKLFFVAVLPALMPVIVNAQQKQAEFNISLADKTEETGLLEAGDWQIESGFLHNRFENSPASEIGQLFIRRGISDKIELRLLIEDGKGRDRYITETVQSTYPLAAGAKFKLLENHPVLPDMTLVGYIQIPFTAHNKKQSLYWSPMLFMAFQHKLNEKWSLNYNAGAQQEAFGNTWSGIFNGALQYKFTDAIEGFGEYFAQCQPNETPQHNVGAGITWQLSDHVAVYIAGGTSVRAEEYNRFYTLGVAGKF